MDHSVAIRTYGNKISLRVDNLFSFQIAQRFNVMDFDIPLSPLTIYLSKVESTNNTGCSMDAYCNSAVLRVSFILFSVIVSDSSFSLWPSFFNYF